MSKFFLIFYNFSLSNDCISYVENGMGVIRWDILIPASLALLFGLIRIGHIILLIGYMLCCLPCYCIPDSCWCKRKFAITNIGVSKKVVAMLETQKWEYKSDKDFEEFAKKERLR